MEQNFLVGPLAENSSFNGLPEKVILFFQMNRSIQENDSHLQFSLALTRWNRKLIKHFTRLNGTPDPYWDFPFGFLHSFYMLPNQMGFPIKW